MDPLSFTFVNDMLLAKLHQRGLSPPCPVCGTGVAGWEAYNFSPPDQYSLATGLPVLIPSAFSMQLKYTPCECEVGPPASEQFAAGACVLFRVAFGISFEEWFSENQPKKST